MFSELTTELKNIINEEINNIHTVLLAKIDRYNHERYTVDVTPYGKFKTPRGDIDYPKITDVPVLFFSRPSSSNDFYTSGICLLIILEYSPLWLKTTNNSGTDEAVGFKFGLNNAIAIPGIIMSGGGAANEG